MMITTMVDLAVDLAALEHNYRQLRRLCDPQVKMLAVVKADAYGHGLLARGPEARRRRGGLPGGGFPGRRADAAPGRDHPPGAAALGHFAGGSRTGGGCRPGGGPVPPGCGPGVVGRGRQSGQKGPGAPEGGYRHGPPGSAAPGGLAVSGELKKNAPPEGHGPDLPPGGGGPGGQDLYS